MSAIASQNTSLTIVYPTVHSRRRWKKTSRLCVTGLCAGNSPVNDEFPHNGPIAQKMFSFDDVIMNSTGTSVTEGTCHILEQSDQRRKCISSNCIEYLGYAAICVTLRVRSFTENAKSIYIFISPTKTPTQGLMVSWPYVNCGGVHRQANNRHSHKLLTFCCRFLSIYMTEQRTNKRLHLSANVYQSISKIIDVNASWISTYADVNGHFHAWFIRLGAAVFIII